VSILVGYENYTSVNSIDPLKLASFIAFGLEDISGFLSMTSKIDLAASYPLIKSLKQGAIYPSWKLPLSIEKNTTTTSPAE